MTFDEFWKTCLPAEVDELKDTFRLCWTEAQKTKVTCATHGDRTFGLCSLCQKLEVEQVQKQTALVCISIFKMQDDPERAIRKHFNL